MAAATAEGEYGGGGAACDGGANVFPEPKGAGGGGGDFLTKALEAEGASETAVAVEAVDGERPRDEDPGLNDRFWERSFAEWEGGIKI